MEFKKWFLISKPLLAQISPKQYEDTLLHFKEPGPFRLYRFEDPCSETLEKSFPAKSVTRWLDLKFAESFRKISFLRAVSVLASEQCPSTAGIYEVQGNYVARTKIIRSKVTEKFSEKSQQILFNNLFILKKKLLRSFRKDFVASVDSNYSAKFSFLGFSTLTLFFCIFNDHLICSFFKQ